LFSPERATPFPIPLLSPRRNPSAVPKLQNEFFVTSSLLTIVRENLRSSDTAKFNARCEDFFSARAYLHPGSDFFHLVRDRLVNGLGRKTALIREIGG
jgi:hypothetical protein